MLRALGPMTARCPRRAHALFGTHVAGQRVEELSLEVEVHVELMIIIFAKLIADFGRDDRELRPRPPRRCAAARTPDPSPARAVLTRAHVRGAAQRSTRLFRAVLRRWRSGLAGGCSPTRGHRLPQVAPRRPPERVAAGISGAAARVGGSWRPPGQAEAGVWLGGGGAGIWRSLGAPRGSLAKCWPWVGCLPPTPLIYAPPQISSKSAILVRPCKHSKTLLSKGLPKIVCVKCAI